MNSFLEPVTLLEMKFFLSYLFFKDTKHFVYFLGKYVHGFLKIIQNYVNNKINN